MPMYDFECTKCGHTFETVTAMGAPPPACPECASPTDRLVSAPLFGQGKEGDKSKNAKRYLSKETQAKLKAKAEREGKHWGPPK
jgi:putative FmdB family regulatory protein